MEVLQYSKSDPPPRRRFAVAGFWIAAASLAVTLTYVAILIVNVRGGARGMTFRLSPFNWAYRLSPASCA